MIYKTLIVDDEPAPRDLLTRLVKNHADIHIEEICSNTASAQLALSKHQPDLIFLDVEMPGQSGIEWLQKLGDPPCEVIFTTSYSQYAVDAFRLAALDFLLKPIDEDQLSSALQRFRHRRETSQNHNLLFLLENLRMSNPTEFKIALPTSNGFIYVKIQDIVSFSSVSNYVVVNLIDKRQIVISRSLKECEEILTGKGFQRIHQSHLINLTHLKRYIRGDGGEVEMEDGNLLEVSRRMKEGLMEVIKKL